jgi:hypothetical protein
MGEMFNPVNWVNAGITALEWLKSQRAEVFMALLLSLVALNMPFDWFHRVGINPQNHTYHAVMLWTFWGSLVYLIVFGGAEIIRRIGIRIRLHHLGNDEKLILKQFVDSKSLSRCLQAGESGAHNLELERILCSSKRSTESFDNRMLCYSLKPWILRSLMRNSQRIVLS